MLGIMTNEKKSNFETITLTCNNFILKFTKYSFFSIREAQMNAQNCSHCRRKNGDEGGEDAIEPLHQVGLEGGWLYLSLRDEKAVFG